VKQPALFPDLPAARGRPQEPVVRGALVRDDCRYWLKRAWGAGPLVAWVMCNPSVADASKDDPTMIRVMEFSHGWGCGSCLVLNLVPLITPYPQRCLAWLKRTPWVFEAPPTKECEQYSDNIEICAEMLPTAQLHIAAWGNMLPRRVADHWLQHVAEHSETLHDPTEDEGSIVEWHCLGVTKSGAPKHPLARGKHRVPDGFKPVGFTP